MPGNLAQRESREQATKEQYPYLSLNQDVSRPRLTQEKFTVQVEGLDLIVGAILVSHLISDVKFGGKDGPLPPKSPPPVGLMASSGDQERRKKEKLAEERLQVESPRVKDILFAGDRMEIKEEEEKNRESTIYTQTKKEEKEKYKEHKIQDIYALVFYNPVTGKNEVYTEKQEIHYDTIEQKLSEEAQAMKDDDKLLEYVASPLLMKNKQQIEKEAQKRLEEISKKKLKFTDDLFADLVKDIEADVSNDPTRLQQAIARRELLLKDITAREQLLEECLQTAQKKGLEEFQKNYLPNLPPLTRKRLEALLKQRTNKQSILNLLLVETLFAKWLKGRLRLLGIKEMATLAKTLAGLTVLAKIQNYLQNK